MTQVYKAHQSNSCVGFQAFRLQGSSVLTRPCINEFVGREVGIAALTGHNVWQR